MGGAANVEVGCVAASIGEASSVGGGAASK